MTPPTSTPLHIVGVSMPRSGHHYLIKLLSLALDADFAHCEYYTPLGCCRTVPCTRSRDARVIFQKNHDFGFALPTDLPDVTYVIQHRAPVMAALSDREYLARLEGRERADDRDEFVVWLGRKAAYIHRFWNKWLRPRRNGHIAIDYAVLLEQPIDVLTDLLGNMGIDFDRAELERVVSEASGHVADFPPVPGTPAFTPRRIETSRYVDAELLSVFESIVLNAVPELEATRCLPATSTDGHLVSLVYHAEMQHANGDASAAAEHLREATRAAPQNPHVWHALGGAHLKAGDVDAALAAHAEAIRLRGDHPEFLRALSDVHYAISVRELAAAVDTARQLLALRPADPGHLIHLASMLSRRQEHAEAVDLAAAVIEAGPSDPQVWRTASEIFASVENWSMAIGAARGAILRDETNAEFNRHLDKLLDHAGRIAPENEGGAPTRDDVRMAYRLLLGREPENEEAVSHHVATHADRAALLKAFLLTAEFERRASQSGVLVAVDLEDHDVHE